MSELTENPEHDNKDASKSVERISSISLWMGILAAFPYLCIILSFIYVDLFVGEPGDPIPSYSVMLVLRILAYPGILGLCFGVPFGLAGIITGVKVLNSQLKTKKIRTFAIIGILLGVIGIIGHILFFVTGQWQQ